MTLEAKIIVNNSVCLVDLAKAINKEELFEFAKEYLKKHVYISNKKLSMEYISVNYNLPSLRMDYDKIKKVLAYRFVRVISLLVREGLIAGYNNSHLYKRVELTKTDSCSIIDKSLSNDIPKTCCQTKNCTGTVKLVYYQGKFVNPKFYDLK